MAAVRAFAFVLAAAALLVLAGAVFAQQVFRYVEAPSGGNEFVLGYPPPVPVDVAGPVDGFRTWSALHARHQDLMLRHDHVSGAVVGSTREGREIWAYVLGDADDSTDNAGPESSLLINGGMHAREWGSPELTTGLIEAAAEGVGDEHLYDYLDENVRFTVLPVSNIDGLVQTQRYPDRVLVGADPRVPERWPRDGRMRRKNMRGADAQLLTVTDHLRGVDLNRNHEPFWATTNASSSNPASLVYHGPDSLSEPESLALLAAADLARTERLRWFEDVHSYTQVLFSIDTFQQRRNALQAKLLSTFSRFHDGWSMARHGHGRFYAQDPAPPGIGIGVAAEYFAYHHEIPSWTLEIEPRNGGEDYGGLGAEHDGFVLPESEVRRLREDMALTHAIVAYRQAGPPSLRRLEIADERGRVVQRREWVYDGPGRRRLESVGSEPLLPGRGYTLRVTFDKPMRWEEAGRVVALPGHDLALAPDIRLGDGTGIEQRLDASAGEWLGGPGAGGLRYRTDSWAMPFTAPVDPALIEAGSLTIRIATRDFTGQALDGDPSTVVDWANGAWSGYESEQGVAGDSGGADARLSVRIVDFDDARRWLLRRGR